MEPLSPVLPDDADVAVRVRGLVTGFGDRTLHDHLDLDVARGEVLGLVGGSGSGKSVLMRTIIGLNPARAGRIEIFGANALDPDPVARRNLRRQWGVLFQEGALFSGLTVAENIEVPMREFLSLPEPVMAELACTRLRQVGLPVDAAAKYPSELSGGMKKRAGLARALALDPPLLFLDEPTSGLDPISAAGFDNLIRLLKDTLGLTLFLITHDLDTLIAICDRVAVLGDGKVLACGTVDQLRAFDHPWVQEYFGGPRGRAATTLPRGEAA
ncbi:ABC transporter ATP-binding protein [Sandarakinorhabdus rubra]|uniref:ABC transporter ATP-binding protein n=1 Tax=Sandarakinorhabdus rubra TaxID=2672568 RepID=UPI0013DA89C1|nr:ATP-binding cassette domain-containing protein [Sandarakinorhabdus rubra]